MSNEQGNSEDKIRALEEQLEAARQKARIEAMEAELAALKGQDAAAADAAKAAEAAAAKAAEEAAAKAAALAAQEQAAREATAKAAEQAAQTAAVDKAAALEAELAAVKAQQAETERLARQQAEADRAAALEAEVAALRAKEAAAASAPVAAPAAPPAAAQVASAPPAAQYAPAPVRAKKGGLVATLLVLILALVATLGATYFAIRGDLRAPWAAPEPLPTDVILIAADSFGPAPALTDSPALITFPALSQPATGATPAAVAQLSTQAVSGDTPEIYGLSYAPCTNPGEEKISQTAAWVAAQNADPTLGLGVALNNEPKAAGSYDTFTDHISVGILLADTRVTYNGYAAGASFPIQVVLQKGTMVWFDRFGVPRLHCGSGVALTAPVAAEGEVQFSGPAWGDFDIAKIVTITPAATAPNTFTLRPVGPSNVQTAFSMSPRVCQLESPCPAPNSLIVRSYENWVKPVSGTTAPTPTECSSWTSNHDSVSTRLVNARTTPVHMFLAQDRANGCTARHDNTLPAGMSWNHGGYWPGTRVIFSDDSGAIIDQYVFGEKTLFVIQ